MQAQSFPVRFVRSRGRSRRASPRPFLGLRAGTISLVIGGMLVAAIVAAWASNREFWLLIVSALQP